MNCDEDGEGWWHGQHCTQEDNNSTEMSPGMSKAHNQKEDHFNCIFDDTMTPLRACGDLAYHVTGNEIRGKEQLHYKDPYSHVKRRRVLDFDSEFIDSPLCNEEMSFRSEEKLDSFEDAISEMSRWVAGFADTTSASGDEHLDPSCEGWIADCLNDNENQFNADDMISSGANDVQIDISDLCGNSPTSPAEKLPVRTRQNVVFKGGKSYLRTPPKLASTIIYPFSFIKPCGAHGDMTLADINQRLHAPKTKKNEQDPAVLYPTSAFSGKPVVGKTKIRTEGGEGSITILRTKG